MKLKSSIRRNRRPSKIEFYDDYCTGYILLQIVCYYFVVVIKWPFSLKISQPKVWRSSTGAVVEVDTVEIEYLREMRLMYEAVCNSTLTEERVRALHLL
jgi:hypothetical protein